MRNFFYFIASLALTVGTMTFAASGAQAAGATAVAGKMLFAEGGKRIGAVYRVTADGSAQVIVNGKMITIPAATLNLADGKLVTSLNRATVLASR